MMLVYTGLHCYMYKSIAHLVYVIFDNVIMNNHVTSLGIYSTALFIITLECTPLIKKIAVKQYAVLRQQQPHLVFTYLLIASFSRVLDLISCFVQ